MSEKSLFDIGSDVSLCARMMNQQYKLGLRPTLAQVDSYLSNLVALTRHPEYPSVYLSLKRGEASVVRVLASSVVNLVVDLSERFGSLGKGRELTNSYLKACSVLATLHLSAHGDGSFLDIVNERNQE